MATENASEIQNNDRSQTVLIEKQPPPPQVVYYGEQKLVPYFLGGHQGYYSDLTPVPAYDIIELLLEVISLTILILTWIFFQIKYNDFNDTIALVFDMNGNVLHTGQKVILYVLPGIDTFMFVILTILEFITNRFRYQVQVTPENSRAIFKLTRKLILLVKLITLLLFVFLTFGTLAILTNDMDSYLMSYAVIVVILYGGLYFWFTLQLQVIVDKTTN